MLSFAQNVLKKSSTPIHYIWGVNAQGEERYRFICCTAAQYDEYAKTFGKPGLAQTDYPIIAQGEGRIPSDEVKQMLVTEYKVNWDDFKDAW